MTEDHRERILIEAHEFYGFHLDALATMTDDQLEALDELTHNSYQKGREEGYDAHWADITLPDNILRWPFVALKATLFGLTFPLLIVGAIVAGAFTSWFKWVADWKLWRQD